MERRELMKRIDCLERELQELKQEVAGVKKTGSWHRTAGIFANDPLFEKAMRYGAAYRRSTRPKNGSRRSKSR